MDRLARYVGFILAAGLIVWLANALLTLPQPDPNFRPPAPLDYRQR